MTEAKLTREFFRAADQCQRAWYYRYVLQLGGEAEVPWAQIDIPAVDLIWALTREGAVSERIQRLFAVRCARRALASVPNPDARSVHAVDVAERFANGEATAEEMAEACAAAYRAAYRAACAVYRAADAADAADAVYRAADAAARAADWASRAASRVADAVYRAADWAAADAAAEREAQVRDFRELLASG